MYTSNPKNREKYELNHFKDNRNTILDLFCTNNYVGSDVALFDHMLMRHDLKYTLAHINKNTGTGVFISAINGHNLTYFSLFFSVNIAILLWRFKTGNKHVLFTGMGFIRSGLKGGYNMLTKCKSFADAFIIQTCGNNKQLDYATPRSTNCACSAGFKQNRFNSA